MGTALAVFAMVLDADGAPDFYEATGAPVPAVAAARPLPWVPSVPLAGRYIAPAFPLPLAVHPFVAAAHPDFAAHGLSLHVARRWRRASGLRRGRDRPASDASTSAGAADPSSTLPDPSVAPADPLAALPTLAGPGFLVVTSVPHPLGAVPPVATFHPDVASFWGGVGEPTP